MTGLELKNWMRARNLEQKDFQRVFNVSQTTLSKWWGSDAVPRYVSLICEVWDDLPEAKRSQWITEGYNPEISINQ